MGQSSPTVAIISGTTGSAQSKIDALTAAGADIAETIEDVVRLTAQRLGALAV